MRVLILAAAVALAGCATQEQMAQAHNEQVMSMALVERARAESKVECEEPACDKLFDLAKIYVQQRADMRVQLVDSTMVATYNPIEWGHMGLAATRTPGPGNSATIELQAVCKGMHPGMTFWSECGFKMMSVYTQFKPFLQSRM